MTYRTVLDLDLLLLIGILHEIIVGHGVLAKTCKSQTRVENDVEGLCSLEASMILHTEAYARIKLDSLRASLL